MTTPILYKTFVADPAWSYNDKLMSGAAGKRKNKRGAANHYSCMSLDAIARLRDTTLEHSITGFRVADDAHLYMWVTNAFIEQGHGICRAWGFEPKTILTWVKPQIGMGWYFRNNTEHVIFAVKGKMRLGVRNQRTSFEAPRRKHSEKPDAFYEIVEKCSPGPYVELFARRARPGWALWGDQAPDAIPALTMAPAIAAVTGISPFHNIF